MKETELKCAMLVTNQPSQPNQPAMRAQQVPEWHEEAWGQLLAGEQRLTA